eukprot:SAG31_NODE_13069_length_895_cov_0.837940_1_plen_215_part_10
MSDRNTLLRALQKRMVVPRSHRQQHDADAEVMAAVRRVKGKRSELVAAEVYTNVCQVAQLQFGPGVVRCNIQELTDSAEVAKWILFRGSLSTNNNKFAQWLASGASVADVEGCHPRAELATEQLWRPLHQVIFHASLVAWTAPNSWLHELLFSPHVLATACIPTMPVDEMAMVMSGLQFQGLKWYKCPRGHPYTVGECGKPMQRAVCAQCGSRIG